MWRCDCSATRVWSRVSDQSSNSSRCACRVRTSSSRTSALRPARTVRLAPAPSTWASPSSTLTRLMSGWWSASTRSRPGCVRRTVACAVRSSNSGTTSLFMTRMLALPKCRRRRRLSSSSSVNSSELSPSRRIEVEPIRISVRAPGAVVTRLLVVTGQLTRAALLSEPMAPPISTFPRTNETRPTRPGGSVSMTPAACICSGGSVCSTVCAGAQVEIAASASRAAV